MNMQIRGTGSALPKNRMTNEQIAQRVETSDEWIRERTGICERHVSTGETVASLAADACKKSLEHAGKSAEDVDLILVATCSPETALPCVACQVQDIIGASNAVAFDLNAACAGFLFALHTAYAYFASGVYRNALIVGSEVLSKIVDWEDRSTCILFGDGAGAVYVEAEDTEDATSNFQFVQHANGSKGMVLTCGTRDIVNPFYESEPMEKYVKMDGKEIFQFAVRQIPMCIEEVLTKAGISKEQVDFYFLHQANARIIEGISRRLKEDSSKFPMNVQMVGNMSSASIPVLLDECMQKGMLKKGQKIVLSGFGAGLTYGACVIML